MVAVVTQNPSDHALEQSGVERLRHLDVFQETIAVAVLSRFVADKDYLLKSLLVDIAVTGTAGDTDVDVSIDGTPVVGLQVTIDNTDANATRNVGSPTAETIIRAGELVEVEVTAAPTAGTGLTAQAVLAELFGET